MKTILDVCAWCSDTLLAVAMLLFVCAVPVGVVYKIIKSK